MTKEQLSDLLEEFYKQNNLEPMCALDSQICGNFNTAMQFVWLRRFCEVWQLAENLEAEAEKLKNI